MKIGIVGSMQFTERMIEIKEKLNKLGHKAFLTTLAEPFIGKTDEEKEKIKLHQKYHKDAIREFWRLMQGADAILVCNFDKHDIKNYIGGNTLIEIGFAHILNQKIFLLNPIPDIPHYKTEIKAVKPIVIYGDLNKLPCGNDRRVSPQGASLFLNRPSPLWQRPQGIRPLKNKIK